MNNRMTYIAGATLLIAIVAWIGVGLFAVTILSDAASHDANARETSSSLTTISRASALRSLAADTADGRTQLNAIVAVDPASLANTVTSVGQAAGVTITITDANSVSSPVVAQASGPGVSTPIQAFSITANATGSFASLMYAASLLESLPLPSSIQELQLAASAPDTQTGKVSWQLNAQIHIITASNI
jgi:hypothetical protein